MFKILITSDIVLLITATTAFSLIYPRIAMMAYLTVVVTLVFCAVVIPLSHTSTRN